MGKHIEVASKVASSTTYEVVTTITYKIREFAYVYKD